MQDSTFPALSGFAKFGYGLALPVLVLFLCQVLLLLSLSGSGSWDGMGLGLATLFILPGMLVANCWVLPWPWTTRRQLFAAGLALPALLVLAEFLWLYGGPARRLIHAAFVAPFLWVWLFFLLLFVPLIASLVYAVRRRSRPTGHDTGDTPC